MIVKLLGVCDKCGGALIKNVRGKVYCPECEVDDALDKFRKKNKEAEKDEHNREN